MTLVRGKQGHLGDQDGRQRLVRHGHLPEREIMTGIGPVAVRCPRVRDRVGEGSERIRFSSAIVPPYARLSLEQYLSMPHVVAKFPIRKA
jgi:putative transposase